MDGMENLDRIPNKTASQEISRLHRKPWILRAMNHREKTSTKKLEGP